MQVQAGDWDMPLTYPNRGATMRKVNHLPQKEPDMERAGVFMSNKSQAVRLPKAVALPAGVRQVDIVPLGRARLIVPAGEGWDSWFAAPGVSSDFMPSREQPAPQQRQDW